MWWDKHRGGISIGVGWDGVGWDGGDSAKAYVSISPTCCMMLTDNEFFARVKAPRSPFLARICHGG